MIYYIIPFSNAGELKFNMDSSEIIKLLGKNYESTVLKYSSPGIQFYFSEYALKILFDASDKVEGIFFYKENFQTIIWNEKNLFHLKYFELRDIFKNCQILEDSETLIILDFGLTFYFNEDKEESPFPEEVGLFREDLKNTYIDLYK